MTEEYHCCKGLQCYQVGGVVRDALLNLPAFDRDWVVVGSTEAEMVARGFHPVAAPFPVFLHPITHEAYALARSERKAGHGYLGFVTTFHPTTTLEEDLARRDLTINAIAITAQGRIVDPFNGCADLQQRLLRHVSPAFAEDPLRVLRVARLHAKLQPLGFRIDPTTLALMRQIVAAGELAYLPVERIWQEFEKAMKTAAPTTFFHDLNDCDALSALFPELERLNFAMACLEQATLISADPVIRCATFMQAMPNAILALCMRMKIPHRYRKLALVVAKWCDLYTRQSIGDWLPEQIVHILSELHAWQNVHELLAPFLLICRAYATALGTLTITMEQQEQGLKRALTAAQQIDVSTLQQLGYTGHALGTAIHAARIQSIAMQLISRF